MKTFQFREKAREILKGKWGKSAVITLVYILIASLLSFGFSFIPFVGNIAFLIVEVPLSYGILVSFIKLKRNEEVGYTDFLETAFSSFASSWKVSGNIFLKVIVPFCLLVASILVLVVSAVLFTFIFAFGMSRNSVATFSTSLTFLAILFFIALLAYIGVSIWLFIKTLLYSQSFIILYDNPNATGAEIVGKSEKLMKGNRGRYFCLSLSFIGWMVLSALSLGIGFLWVMPYLMIANILFYENLIENDDSVDNVA